MHGHVHLPNVIDCGNSQLTSSSASTEPPQLSEDFYREPDNPNRKKSENVKSSQNSDISDAQRDRMLMQGRRDNIISCENSQLTSTSASTEPPELSETNSEGMEQQDEEPCCSKSVASRKKSNNFEIEETNMGQINLRDRQQKATYRMHQAVETQYSAGTEYSESNGSNQLPRQPAGRKPLKVRKVYLETLKSISRLQSKCWFCRKKTRLRLRQPVKYIIWKTEKIWIPDGTRCCSSHLSNGRLNNESSEVLRSKATSGAHLSKRELCMLIHMLTNAANRSPIDLDKCDLEDSDNSLLFGIQEHQFRDLLTYIQAHLRQSCNRSPQNALGIFLMKLRLGVSHKILGFLFGVPQRKIGSTFWRVAEILEKEFVPQHLGYGSLERKVAQQEHDSAFVRSLYDVPTDKIVLFLDATYLYVQKSGDHDLQQNRNLLKPMIVILPSDYIVDCAGLYFSDCNHNDAAILSDMFKGDNGIDSFVQPEDVFVVDRGFRDVAEFLQDTKGMTVKMPKLLKPHQAQFTAAEANESRMVTLTRWRVEAVNGWLKNLFRFFDLVIASHYFNKDCDKKVNVNS